VNGDGMADLIWVGGDHLEVGLSKGEGTFQLPTINTVLSGTGWNVSGHFRFAGINGDGATDFSQVTSSYSCNDPANVTTTPCTVGIGKRYFVYANQSTSSNWDLNGAALPVTTTNAAHDNWGNATAINVGTSDGFSKSTVNTYSNDSTNWLLGRLLRASVTSVSP
jgi:hypothetical protein